METFAEQSKTRGQNPTAPSTLTAAATHRRMDSRIEKDTNAPSQPAAAYHHGQRTIQAKLAVNDPGDAYEQEADGIAQRVMGMQVPQAGRDGSSGSIAAAPNGAMQTKGVGAGNGAGMEAPAIAHEALNSSGQPLESGARDFMETRFGWSFGNVRVHADARAAVAARAIQARAFTSGRDIVFGAGEYAPGTTEGRTLLAHELTHVVQQGGASRARSRSGEHGSREQGDRLNEQTSDHDMSGERETAKEGGVKESVPTQAPQSGVIQRSFWRKLGHVLGVVGGAIIGGIAGFAVGGPVGAVAGAIGGALLGDRLTARRRALTSAEIAYAREIYKDSIDYSKIHITRDSLLSVGAPKTIGNTIHLKSSWGEFKGDTMELSNEGMITLIHEMGHVWQYQNGGLAYIPKSLWAQLKASLGKGSRDGAYNWEEAHDAHIPWEKWNPEQQAEAIEEYNIMLRRSREPNPPPEVFAKLAILLPYMQKVWNRQGAPHFF
ncbi:MAG TPA: DUF4157 domain-containing protein [Candidatus Kapabacteria bacterium]|nr:DUF4157 domain-containing protein [Candidatus Kapabacteria bacterium]